MRRYPVVTWDMIAWTRSFGLYQPCRTRANERVQNIHDYLTCFIIAVIVKIKNCNLFNHGALRSSYELFETCLWVPDQIGIWKCWFKERGKPEYPEKNLSSKGENQQQTQPTGKTCGVDAIIRTLATLVGGECSLQLAPMRHPFSLTVLTIDRFHMTSRQPYLCTKQWIGGHVCVQKNPVGIELFSYVQNFLLFQAICKAADHRLKTIYTQ